MQGFRPKVIYDPLGGVVDIHSVRAMVDAPEFQLLRERRQLSLADIAFPAARHSRFEHSIGAFAATRRLADRWVSLGIIDVEMRRALMGYALYHDIGHAAFSHVTEDFCGDHKIRTRAIVAGMKGVVEQCNINHDLMMSLISHENPLHKAVSDKNIGIEKLDYLERDGWYTGVGCPAGVKYLRKFMYFAEGQVCIDEKMVEHVVDTLRFYMQMYKDVYLRKSLVIAQRTFHKLLSYCVAAGELDPLRLADMTDAEVIGLVSGSRHHGARALYGRLRRRDLLKEAVVIRSEARVCETRVVTKQIMVCGVPEEGFQRTMRSATLKKENHVGLEAIETQVASLLKLHAYDVVVVPALYADKFVAQDVMIYGSSEKIESLRARRPKAFESMEETARAYAAVRVAVPEEHREKAYKAAPDILDLIENA